MSGIIVNNKNNIEYQVFCAMHIQVPIYENKFQMFMRAYKRFAHMKTWGCDSEG